MNSAVKMIRAKSSLAAASVTARSDPQAEQIMSDDDGLTKQCGKQICRCICPPGQAHGLRSRVDGHQAIDSIRSRLTAIAVSDEASGETESAPQIHLFSVCVHNSEAKVLRSANIRRIKFTVHVEVLPRLRLLAWK